MIRRKGSAGKESGTKREGEGGREDMWGVVNQS